MPHNSTQLETVLRLKHVKDSELQQKTMYVWWNPFYHILHLRTTSAHSMQKVHTHSAMEPQFMHCSNLYNITLRDDSKFIMPSEQNLDHTTDVREEPDAHCTTCSDLQRSQIACPWFKMDFVYGTIRDNRATHSNHQACLSQLEGTGWWTSGCFKLTVVPNPSLFWHRRENLPAYQIWFMIKPPIAIPKQAHKFHQHLITPLK